ncbi:thioredoxin [Pseudoxanthomonas kalamensis DSM 18571]|nr:thioredoxin [Pseudoxanthomonas kalamensis DSM 18571]
MVAIGDPMPALTLPDPDGQPLKLPGRFAGRPLLINVWASWCGPCLQEMPELDRYSREQGDNGVQVIGLALDTPEAVRAFLRQLPVHYPIVLDLPGADDASVRLGNVRGALPYTVLIDANGRIAKQKLGPFQPGEIDGWTR